MNYDADYRSTPCRTYLLFQLENRSLTLESESENLFFLYVINGDGKIKSIISKLGKVEYALKHKNNLYLKIGNKIWVLDENDVLKNKFPANKMIIKDSEISFE